MCVCVREQVILSGAVRPCFLGMLTELIAFEAGIDLRVVVESCVVVDSLIGLVKLKRVRMRDEVVTGLGGQATDTARNALVEAAQNGWV